MSTAREMYQCQVHYCGYVYDPDIGDPKHGIDPGTKFEDLPDDWKCPFCAASKHMFKPLAGPGSVHWENIKSNPANDIQTDEQLEKIYHQGEVELKSPDAADSSIT
jgi:rubredoxin